MLVTVRIEVWDVSLRKAQFEVDRCGDEPGVPQARDHFGFGGKLSTPQGITSTRRTLRGRFSDGAHADMEKVAGPRDSRSTVRAVDSPPTPFPDPMPIKIVSPILVTLRGGKHAFACEGGALGDLTYSTSIARFDPTDGLPLSIRKEPGITASHYQMWNLKDGKTSEFFASSYRWSIWMREIRVHYGNNDYYLVPMSGWGRGYELVDSKRKRILAIEPAGALSRGVKITIDKIETELACIIFTYFLARTVWMRSAWPAPSQQEIGDRKQLSDAAAVAAARKAEELAQAMMPGGVKKAGVDTSAK